MEFKTINEELLAFLDQSPNAFYAVKNLKDMLREKGFSELREEDSWAIEPGRDYFVIRNGSALIAFRMPEKSPAGFQIMAAHADSPVFKIKGTSEIEMEKYVKLNVEKYGGMLCAPWFDRPLSAAGRVVIRTDNGVETRLINIDEDLLIIPNLAIHMNRQVNDGYAYNVQKDLLPLFREKDNGNTFLARVAKEAGVCEADILDMDLFLYNRQKGTMLGLNKEFIASGRLDDLQCVFASAKGFLEAVPGESIAVLSVFDNEEVGSVTKQGAASTFLKDTLHRIYQSFGKDEEGYYRALASSFMVSADNAHAVHPNQPDKTDPVNRPYLNHGIVVKYSANQKYTTDAVSGAIFRSFCEKAGVPYQIFLNRSDMIGGSTLGNLSGTQVAVNTVDIGLAQLAMHSPYETAGAADTAYLARVARLFFSSAVIAQGDGSYRIG